MYTCVHCIAASVNVQHSLEHLFTSKHSALLVGGGGQEVSTAQFTFSHFDLFSYSCIVEKDTKVVENTFLLLTLYELLSQGHIGLSMVLLLFTWRLWSDITRSTTFHVTTMTLKIHLVWCIVLFFFFWSISLSLLFALPMKA